MLNGGIVTPLLMLWGRNGVKKNGDRHFSIPRFLSINPVLELKLVTIREKILC